MNYQEIAKQVIEYVGGKENINSAFHCATRLRIKVKDDSLIQEKKLEEVEGVKGTFLVQDQFQIIFGSGTVDLVTDEVLKQLGHVVESVQPVQEKKGNVALRAVKLLSDIFVPIIPAIVAAGLLMGINNVLTAQGLFFAKKSIIEAYPTFKDFASMINLFSNAAFTFLPVLVGYSATKKFGGNPYLGAVMGMIMVHPDLLNLYNFGKPGVEVPYWNLFGLKIAAVGYQGTVLPILASSFIIAKTETFLHKKTPSWLDNLTTPLVSVLLTGFITFLFVGPVLREAGNVLASFLQWLYFSLGAFGGFIFGLLYAPIVITGMHQSFIAIETQLLAQTHQTFIFPIATMSNVAQGAAVLAVFFLTKDQRTKSLASASGISALLGITEPAMFGVNLKLRYPFIGAICGSAVGSAWIGFTKTQSVALGTAGIPGFISIAPASWMNYGIGMVASIITAFIVTIFLHKRNEAKKENIVAVATGEVKNITETPDEIFASKTMGDGYVVTPQEGKIYAPISGEITMIFPTKHAIGISNGETEILIHVGIDTVELEGIPFTSALKQGDKVKQGDLLMEADLKYILEHGKKVETAVVVTNGKEIELIKEGNVNAKEEVVRLK